MQKLRHFAPFVGTTAAASPRVRPLVYLFLPFVGLATGAVGAPRLTSDAGVQNCAVEDVDYSLAANLKVTRTTMGAGDGEYRIGPGRLGVRYFGSDASPKLAALLYYEMRQAFVLVAQSLFWTTKVTTNILSRASSTDSGVVAEGKLESRMLRWSRAAPVFRSDGRVTCEGFFCGKFGAPPAGTTEFHAGPDSLVFNPFEFDTDRKTFKMAAVVSSNSESPRHTTLLSFSGRELTRTCVQSTR
jgi:hypothetical protein